MVFTIGYGKRPVEEFIALLERYDITELYDIRTYPRSRWQTAYNAGKFAATLKESGITYSHRKNLGGKDTELLDQEARKADLLEIAEVGKKRNVVIMCSEMDFTECHRKDVALELIELGAGAIHISKDGETAQAEKEKNVQLALEILAQTIETTQDWREQAKGIFDNLDVTEGTRKDYKQRIGLFFSFLEGRAMNPNIFLEYKRYLADRSDYGVSTKNKYLIAARIFLKELYRLGHIPADVTATTKSFSQSKLHKREGLSASEVKELSAMLAELPDNAINLRLKALFCLLAMQGLRQIEVVRLDVQDLDLTRKVAFVRGKGRDDKEPVHLHPETIKHLRAYLKGVKIADGAVFKSLGNRKSARINTLTIQRQMKRLFAVAGIDRTVHGFRHFYVTSLLERLDVRDVRKFSRHRSIETLVIYDDEIDVSKKAVEVFKCFDGLLFG